MRDVGLCKLAPLVSVGQARDIFLSLMLAITSERQNPGPLGGLQKMMRNYRQIHVIREVRVCGPFAKNRRAPQSQLYDCMLLYGSSEKMALLREPPGLLHG